MRSRKTAKALVLACVAGGVVSAAAGQSITTTTSNNGSGGVFMDLAPTGTALQLNAFATYFSSSSGTPVQVEVWTRPGSYVGNTASNAGWTLTQTVPGVSAGTTTEATVNLTTPITLPSGSTTAVYLHSITTGGGIRYNGTSSAPPQTFWSNSDITLFSDVARTGAVAFGGSQFTPRTFAGTLYYAPSDPNATGACCFPNGTCQVLTVANCSAQNGTYQGVNTQCGNCPQPGACCLLNGTCISVQATECTAQNGVFQGGGSVCGTQCVPGSTVYAIDLRSTPNRLITFGVNLPAQNVVSSNAGFDGFAMDFNGSATTLYGITYPSNELGTIDQTTGNFTHLAYISGAAEANWGGLTFDPATNTWFALGTAAGANNLYTLDINTGVATLVGPMTNTGIFIDIAADASGNLFAHNISDDSLYSVNKATGEATLIGPTGINANFAQGMDFDFATNKLFATIYVGTGEGYFVEINTSTGAATVITPTTSWNAEMEMAIKAPAGGPQCYANCDGSTTSPVLNVADFSCFLTKFAGGC